MAYTRSNELVFPPCPVLFKLDYFLTISRDKYQHMDSMARTMIDYFARGSDINSAPCVWIIHAGCPTPCRSCRGLSNYRSIQICVVVESWFCLQSDLFEHRTAVIIPESRSSFERNSNDLLKRNRRILIIAMV